MSALHLDQLTWLKVKEEIAGGRDTVVLALGSTEQHGRHLPLATDAMLGDAIALGVAERLDAFLAPTLRVGCSAHHLAFPGTLSISERTFRGFVADVVASLMPRGFRRIVLLPTHGGNFKPLAAAVADIEPAPGTMVMAFTDLEKFLQTSLDSSAARGIGAAAAGAHAGEWETSAVLALRPDLVVMEAAEEGFVGALSEALSKVFQGIDAVDKNGVIGDPRPATAEAGKRYLEDIIEMISQWVVAQDAGSGGG